MISAECKKKKELIRSIFAFVFNRTLQKHYVYYPELPLESAHIHQRTAAFESEVEGLERKLFLEEIAVDIADERCDFLDKNLRYGEVKYFIILLSGIHTAGLMKLRKYLHEILPFNVLKILLLR